MSAVNFTGILSESNNKLWSCHIVVPEAIANIFLEQGSQRVVCTLNDVMTYQCAIVPYTSGQRVITVNKSILKKLNLSLNNNVQVALEKDESEYGLPMPEELEELLKIDEIGNQYFKALTDGKKRTLLYIIAKPKNSDKRIRYAIAVVEHLKAEKGKINYKTLDLLLKSKE